MTKIQRFAEYKDTGVDWLGQLPTHWDVVPSKWLFSLRAERPAPGAVHLMASQKYGVISQAKFMAEKDQRVVQTIVGGENMKRICVNDFLIHLRSFQGGIEWSANEGKVSPAYTVLSPSKVVHPPFFYYLLKSDGYIQELRATTNQLRDGQSMNYSQFATVPLIEVPWDEQVAIASFLDRETAQIDELIGKQERLIELLAEKRQAIITHAVTNGLDPTAPTKPSGIPWLGEVPAHWKVGPVKHFYDIVLGKMLQRDQEVDTDARLPYLKAASIRSGTISLLESNQMWFSKDEVASLSLRSGDVLVVEGGSIGQSALVDEDMAGIGFEKSLNRVRPKTGSTSEYFQHYMTMARESGYVAMQCVGATFMHLTSEKLGRMIMPFPPEHEQRQIASNIEQHLLRLENASSKGRRLIDLLRERRSALVSAAVTGKIDVTNEGVAA